MRTTRRTSRSERDRSHSNLEVITIEEFAKSAGSRMKLLRLALLLLAVVGAAGQRIGAEV